MKPRNPVTAIVSILLAPIISSGVVPAQTHSPELNPYVNFLRTQNVSAKDYILGLFKTKDIVMLCERDHRDTTQYDLYLSLISDKRFIAEVGNVFTEIGTSTLNPRTNAFLHTDGLSQDSLNKLLISPARHLRHQSGTSPGAEG
jgi:hypothetical protein